MTNLLSRTRPALPLLALLTAQAGLLGWAATRHSPTIDEVGHLAAGLHNNYTGTFDLYRVNPPLVRVVATTPLAAAGVELPGHPMATAPPARPEFDLGRVFVDRHGERAMWHFAVARWACIPFALLATTVVFAWASALYGRAGGWLAAVLWAACPTALTSGQMITPDMGATAFGLAASYLFWRWAANPGWRAAVAAGVVLGLAELCKTTWVLLVPVWVVVWAIYRVRYWKPDLNVRPGLGQLLVIFGIGLYVLNVGYLFEGTGTRLGELRFVSRVLTVGTETGGRTNAFANTWAGRLPMPFPRNYLEGMDVQKRDFESEMLSYLRGDWRHKGWWYYYLYGLLVKTPVGTLAVIALAVAGRLLGRGPRPGWRAEVAVLLPGVTVLTFVSSQTGFNHHLRYILPAIPFLYIWAGRVAADVGHGGHWVRRAGAIAAIFTVASSMAVYPHTMSYFNEPAGGPLRGGEHLVDSNVDWGQDLLHMKQWLDEHPEARPLGLAYFGYIDPTAVGIPFTLPPRGPGGEPTGTDAPGPQPGWYAVSVTMLRGYRYSLANGKGRLEDIDGRAYSYFLHTKPVATAGYSIWIYHLDENECNRLRNELGLPQLPAR